MIIIISIIVIILLYLCLEWIYKQYKNDLNNIEKQSIYMQKKISEVERSNMANIQLIQWLYDELTKKKIIDDINKK